MWEEAVRCLRKVVPLPTTKLCSKEKELVNPLMKTINNSKRGHLRNLESHLLAVGVEVPSNNSLRSISLGARVITEASKTLRMMTMGKEEINLTLTAALMTVLMILTH
jgi:hypothetical protein